MYHLIDTLTNKAGDALVGYRVKLKNSAGSFVSIYADESATPIVSVSGEANTAITDDYGLYSLFVDDGTYDIVFFDKDDANLLLRTLHDVPMYGETLSAVAVEDARDAALAAQAAAEDAQAAAEDEAAAAAASAAAAAADADDVAAANAFHVSIARATLAALTALTGPYDEGTSAAVFADGTSTNNGVYSWTSGAWVKNADLPADSAADSAAAAAADAAATEALFYQANSVLAAQLASEQASDLGADWPIVPTVYLNTVEAFFEGGRSLPNHYALTTPSANGAWPSEGRICRSNASGLANATLTDYVDDATYGDQSAHQCAFSSSSNGVFPLINGVLPAGTWVAKVAIRTATGQGTHSINYGKSGDLTAVDVGETWQTLTYSFTSDGSTAARFDVRSNGTTPTILVTALQLYEDGVTIPDYITDRAARPFAGHAKKPRSFRGAITQDDTDGYGIPMDSNANAMIAKLPHFPVKQTYNGFIMAAVMRVKSATASGTEYICSTDSDTDAGTTQSDGFIGTTAAGLLATGPTNTLFDNTNLIGCGYVVGTMSRADGKQTSWLEGVKLREQTSAYSGDDLRALLLGGIVSAGTDAPNANLAAFYFFDTGSTAPTDEQIEAINLEVKRRAVANGFASTLRTLILADGDSNNSGNQDTGTITIQTGSKAWSYLLSEDFQGVNKATQFYNFSQSGDSIDEFEARETDMLAAIRQGRAFGRRVIVNLAVSGPNDYNAYRTDPLAVYNRYMALVASYRAAGAIVNLLTPTPIYTSDATGESQRLVLRGYILGTASVAITSDYTVEANQVQNGVIDIGDPTFGLGDKANTLATSGLTANSWYRDDKHYSWAGQDAASALADAVIRPQLLL